MGNDLRRRAPIRKPFKRYLICCEGKVTETEYFEDLRTLAKVPITFKFENGATPKTLVEKAVELLRKRNREARKGKLPEFDEIWCVFDVDTHDHLPEAKQQARDNDIPIAVSNPCFELWAILHFEDQYAYMSHEQARARCKQLIPGYHKKLPCDLVLNRTEDATKRARELEKINARNGSPEGNPSTGVHRLVESILAQRQSQGGMTRTAGRRCT